MWRRFYSDALTMQIAGRARGYTELTVSTDTRGRTPKRLIQLATGIHTSTVDCR